MIEILSKNKERDSKNNQEELKDRFRYMINRVISNSLNQISYRELLSEGLWVKSFYEVIEEVKMKGWEVEIGEFDIFLK